jgi:hypothetical protein
METCDVTCPTCFERFSIGTPPASEVPCEIDYDCEICCRPMVISLFTEGEVVEAEARGIHD